MPLQRCEHTLAISGECGAEEALELVENLSDADVHTVDISECTHMHTVLVQALAACAPQRVVPPQEEFLARWLMPFLASSIRQEPGLTELQSRSDTAALTAA